MQKQDCNNKHANMTTSTKKTIFLVNKPKMKNKTPEIKGRFFYNHATYQSLVHNPLTIGKKSKKKILKLQNHEKRKKKTTCDEAETKTVSKNEIKMKNKRNSKKCIKISQRKPCMGSEP